ncbi:MAG: hypothetical protein ACETVR_00940, partial [Candidatus Bathyarchaeia archaeon]
VLYAVETKERTEPFTSDMEQAALYVLAESKRNKGGGRIFKRKGEEISFLAKAYYPLRIKSSRGTILLFDLLELNKATLRYRVMPDLDPLFNDLSKTETPSALNEYLVKYLPLLKGFGGEEVIEVEGLIAHQEITSDLHFLLQESRGFRKEHRVGNLVFTPIMSKETIEENRNRIVVLEKRIKSDVKNLESFKRRLGEKMGLINQTIVREIDQIKREANKEIRRIRARVAKITRAQKRVVERELKRIDSEYKRKTASLLREKEGYEKELAEIRKQLGEQTLERQPQSEAPSPEEKSKLDETLGILKKRLGEFEEKIAGVERALKELEAWSEAQQRQVREDSEKLIAEEEGKTGEVEKARDEAVAGQMGTLNQLNSRVDALYSQIDALAGAKRESLQRLDLLTVKVKGETTDLYMPFYLVCYKDGEDRFDVYPPVSVSTPAAFTTLLRKRLSGSLESRMEKLLAPRYSSLNKILLKGLREALQVNQTFRNIVKRAGEEADLLRRPRVVEGIKKGLVVLRREGWITDKEYLVLEEPLLSV